MGNSGDSTACQVDDPSTPHVADGTARWRVHAADGWHLNACDAHVVRCLTEWGQNVVEALNDRADQP